MPIYEYTCTACSKTFDALVLKASDTPTACPHCGSADFSKQLSAGSFRPHGIPTGSGGFKSPSCGPAAGG
ncbi:MAG: transcriptional regulator [Deltaproteobacteria bacterium]|nr:MAG: transcriptional regulator [Deltaproteobacteria bacterium]